MIRPEVLEICQQPPQPGEGMGTVDPFTGPELEAIARYNEAEGILEDCLDGVILGGAADGFRDHEREYGHDAAIDYIKTHFGWLNDWFEALDSLDADLRDGGGRLSNAAERVLTYEASWWYRTRDNLRVEALLYLIGDAGPCAFADGGQLVFSNGYVEINL